MAQSLGTPVVWTLSGGTYVMTMTSLANGAGRAGPKHDFGASFPEYVYIRVEFDFNAAPTAGLPMLIYMAASHDNTDFDGEVPGTDGAYNSEDDMARLQYVGALSASNDTNPQATSFLYRLTSRYGCPVVLNASGQALTATGADQIITITPLDVS